VSSIRSNVAIRLGPFFRVNTNIKTAVKDEDKDVSFSNVCTGHPPFSAEHAPSGVSQRLECKACKNDDKTSFKKGRQVGTDYVLLTQEEIAGAEVGDDLKKEMTLFTHPASDFVGTTLPGGKAYAVEPAAGEADSYALFLAMIRETPDLAYVTTWASRSKPALYRLLPFGDVLTVQQVAWPSSLAEMPETGDGNYKASDLAMAVQIARAAVQPYDPAAYKNERNEKLTQFITNAVVVAGATVDTPEGKAAAEKPSGGSLSAMLEAALAAAQPAPAAEAPKKRAPRKKAAASAA
jgi:non-homologous end joining protein Ku